RTGRLTARRREGAFAAVAEPRGDAAPRRPLVAPELGPPGTRGRRLGSVSAAVAALRRGGARAGGAGGLDAAVARAVRGSQPAGDVRRGAPGLPRRGAFRGAVRAAGGGDSAASDARALDGECAAAADPQPGSGEPVRRWRAL